MGNFPSNFPAAIGTRTPEGLKELQAALDRMSIDINGKDLVSAEAASLAAARGNHEDGSAFLYEGVNVNGRSETWWGHSALVIAADEGHVEVVSLLLGRGADINASYGRRTALIAAAENGHENVVSLLLDRGVDVNATPNTWWGNALIAAAEGGHKDVLSLLLDRGADIHATDPWRYQNALIAAAAKGHQDVVSVLLDRGADVNASHGPKTALIVAAQAGHRDVVSLLLDRGANIDAAVLRSHDGMLRTAVVAAVEEGHTDVVLLLLDRGAQINATVSHRYQLATKTALTIATERGHENVISLLLDRGADVNASNVTTTALIEAAGSGREDLVLLLLDRGAGINVVTGQDRDGNTRTALTAAANMGHKDLILLLLDHGADINATNATTTPLIEAVETGRENIVSLLLSKGANINMVSMQDRYGNPRTALIAAAETDQRHMILELLLHAADINAVAVDGNMGNGRTALIAAAGKGHINIVSLLLEQGANLNAIHTRTSTPLIAAAREGHGDIVSLLLFRGANINAMVDGQYGNRDTYYGTALIAAASEGHKHVVSLLVERGADINICVSSHGLRYSTALIALTVREIEDRIWPSADSQKNGSTTSCILMKFLLDHGADVNILDESSDYGTALITALSILVKKRHWDPHPVVLLLLNHGADVNIVAGAYGTALGLAAYEGNEIYASLFLERGADVFRVGGKYHTPNGRYPTAIDAGQAGGKALPSMFELLSKSGGGNTKISYPPFPMPYTGAYKPNHKFIIDHNIPIIDFDRQRESVSNLHVPASLTPEQASLSCRSLGVDVLFEVLVTLVGIERMAAERHEVWILNDIRYFLSKKYDLGLAYAACRVAWKDFNAEASNIAAHRAVWLSEAQRIDEARANALYWDTESGQELIRSPYEVMPRRIWDVIANRVVEFRMMHSDVLARCRSVAKKSSVSPAFWALTHSWTSNMNPLNTPINQYQWPVPLPHDIDIECDLRKELLNFGAEYIWLDVLCLRQFSAAPASSNTTTWISSKRTSYRSLEVVRTEEWKLDVPTIGNIYRAATGLVRYFNGLGRRFSSEGWDNPQHWLRRAWTLQEIRTENTTLNGGILHDDHILMNDEGRVDGNPTTMRHAIRSIAKLAAEVDSLSGCSVYDLAREMKKRYATKRTDKVAGLLYLLRTTKLPTYDETLGDEDAWRQWFHLLPLDRKIEILSDFPDRGSKDQWFPTWTQLLAWPEHNPEYIHVRSVWPENCNRLQLVQPPESHTGKNFMFVPNIWAIPDIQLRKTSRKNEFDIRIGNRVFGFYGPYNQTSIAPEIDVRYTLATVSFEHSNNWVVCEMQEIQNVMVKSLDGTESIAEVKILKKIGILATDSCSELLIHAGTSRSILKKINCLFT